MGSNASNRPQLVIFLALSSILTHALGQAIPSSAASTSSSESASSSQPLWSYQVKPGGYVNSPASQPSHYTAGVPSLFDAFNGLSQRQGALTSSPFLSILPIILIAAGGMLLLLPFLTMMMASPFGGGGFGGGFNNGFGYPQVGALNKKRSLNDQFGPKTGLGDIFEHVSATIEELAKKYTPSSQLNRRTKPSSNGTTGTTGENQASAATPGSQQPGNHKLSGEETNSGSSFP